jgi:hypothetical protein
MLGAVWGIYFPTILSDVSEKRDTKETMQRRRGDRIKHTEKMREWMGQECRCGAKRQNKTV